MANYALSQGVRLAHGGRADACATAIVRCTVLAAAQPHAKGHAPVVNLTVSILLRGSAQRPQYCRRKDNNYGADDRNDQAP